MTRHEELLKEIRERKSSGEFNVGILPADSYVRTMEQMCGTDTCYKYVSNGNVSLYDAIKTASKKLTYNNPDMEVKDIYTDFKSKMSDLGLNQEEVELPKNTLMVFRNTLTTPRKDRDGDVMRTMGAKVDPKMLLLWQHVHTLPIGKMLAIATQNSKTLDVITAIVDMNDLSHDAAVMVENKMGRFSHGFKALEFQKIKSLELMSELEEEFGIEFTEGEKQKARDGKAAGFDVSQFEVMEESLVSVPANGDAETHDVYLSLLGSKKLKSSMMKSFGQTLRSQMAKQVPVNVDIKVSLNGKSINNQEIEDEPESEKGKGKEGCSCGGAPKQKEQPEATKEEQAETDGKKMTCPECGGKMENGVCKKCGYKGKEDKEDDEKEFIVEEKGYYHGMLKGSWEYVESMLREKSRKFLLTKDIALDQNSWVGVIATYPSYAIISVETLGDQKLYKAAWKNEDEPEFYGDIKEVEVQISTELIEKMFVGRKRFDMDYEGVKSGRVLSKSNYDKLVGVRDDIKEMDEGQIITTRSGQALCKSCMTKLTEVIDSAKMESYTQPEKEVQEELSIKDAMVLFIAKSTGDERKHMQAALTALDLQEQRTEKSKSIGEYFSR